MSTGVDWIWVELVGEPLIWIVCRICALQFAICQHCYRGHVYCGKECAKAARRASNKRSQKKFRESDEGKAAHREQEQERRDRKRQEKQLRVGKQGSTEGPSSVIMLVPLIESVEALSVELKTGGEDHGELNQQGKIARGLESALEARRPRDKARDVEYRCSHRCWVCGRRGYIVPAFPSWERHYPKRNKPLTL